MLVKQPITLREANKFVTAHHRHNSPVRGWKFGVAVNNGEKIVGVAIASRPVARMLDNGFTLEVTRCCTDGTKNACSMLYNSIWRAGRALGYTRCITYTLQTEIGYGLKGAGWKIVDRNAGGGSWSRKNRNRTDKHSLGAKIRWEIGVNA
jgi:hypothetical protein